MSYLNRCGLVIGLVLFSGAAAAEDGQEMLDQIAQQRSTAEAEWLRQEDACRARFVVQSCLDDVAAKRRKLERSFSSKEAAIHAVERKQRAQEQRERSADKQREYDERAAATQKETSMEERAQAQRDKLAAHQQIAGSASTRAVKDLPTPPNAAAQASAQEAFTAKQRAAQERRLARDKRLRESKGAPQPLPAKP